MWRLFGEVRQFQGLFREVEKLGSSVSTFRWTNRQQLCSLRAGAETESKVKVFDLSVNS